MFEQKRIRVENKFHKIKDADGSYSTYVFVEVCLTFT
jgi:hypothetical protein